MGTCAPAWPDDPATGLVPPRLPVSSTASGHFDAPFAPLENQHAIDEVECRVERTITERDWRVVVRPRDVK